jgi:GAF domain-containing protein
VADLEGQLSAVSRSHRGQATPAAFEEILSCIVGHIARLFEVSLDEVAVLLRRHRGGNEVLRFAYPLEFLRAGRTEFPTKGTKPSFASRTLWSREPLLANRAAAERHLDAFEKIPSQDRAGLAIQRLMSVPLWAGPGNPIGVLQVSRKGPSPEEAGPEFTPEDLAGLAAVGQQVGPYLLRVTPRDF